MADLPEVGALIDEAMRLSKRLEALTDEQYRIAKEIAQASADFEDAQAAAWRAVRADMGPRDDHGEKWLSRDFVEATHERVKEMSRDLESLKAQDKALDNAGRNLRQQLSALQSVAGAVRDEIKLAGAA